MVDIFLGVGVVEGGGGEGSMEEVGRAGGGDVK